MVPVSWYLAHYPVPGSFPLGGLRPQFSTNVIAGGHVLVFSSAVFRYSTDSIWLKILCS